MVPSITAAVYLLKSGSVLTLGDIKTGHGTLPLYAIPKVLWILVNVI